jgi:membrane fusion protein, multidrug efflux system
MDLKATVTNYKFYLSVSIIGLLSIGYFFIGNSESTDDAFIEGNIVAISPKLSGYIAEVLVEDNQLVEEGQKLAQIDQVDYQNLYQKAQAALEAAQAQLDVAKETLELTKISAPSNYDSIKSQVETAKINYEHAAKDLKRIQDLDTLTLSQKDRDAAIANEKATRSQFEEAQAKFKAASTVSQTIAIAEGNITQLTAMVHQAEAVLADAQQKLTDTTIIAPQKGQVTNKHVQKGMHVMPGQKLLSLVMPEIWVIANFKETQFKKMRTGQKVEIKIDAYPQMKFTGKIDSIQDSTGSRLSLFPPENATGNFVKVVQRIPVKIVFDKQPDPNLSIVPGMSVIPTVLIN